MTTHDHAHHHGPHDAAHDLDHAHVGSNHRHDDHSHGSHGHVHAPTTFGAAFAIGIGLNTAFIVIEALYGFLANSSALLADAGHNLSDVLGLIVAWIAATLSQRAPSERMTFGLRKTPILAALANALLLLIACGAIAVEAVQRFVHPQPVASGTIMIVAAIGIVVNGATAWLFASGSKHDINIRGAYLHMVADAAVSAGVVVAGLVIMFTGWVWLDPLASLVIVAVIVWGTWGLLTESTAMSLAAVPSRIDPAAVRDFLCRQGGVAAIYHLHIWPMSTTDVALTAHLVMPEGHPGDAFLVTTAHELDRRFGIGHATLQIETDPATGGALAQRHAQPCVTPASRTAL